MITRYIEPICEKEAFIQLVQKLHYSLICSISLEQYLVFCQSMSVQPGPLGRSQYFPFFLKDKHTNDSRTIDYLECVYKKHAKHTYTHKSKSIQNSIQSKIFTLLHDHNHATQPNRHTIQSRFHMNHIHMTAKLLC